MQKYVELAKSISKKPDVDYSSDLHHINLHVIFAPVYKLPHTTRTCNIIVAFIIFCYDKDSTWLDIRKDRTELKLKVLRSLDTDPTSELFSNIVSNQEDVVNEVITEYLMEQTDWRWQSVLSLLDYHANMIRFANQKTATERNYSKTDKEGTVNELTEDYDQDKIVKVNKEKGALLKQALDARLDADKLLTEMRKDFVELDSAVKSDFGFELTDEKKIDPLKWRHFIIDRNEKRIKAQN